MTRTWSLAGVAAACAAATNILAMAAYGAYQYATGMSTSVSSLVVEHLGHVLVLAAVGYAGAWLVMRRLVVEPIRRTDAHLYRIGAGELRPLELKTNLRELEALVHGVNLMLERMRLGFDAVALEKAEHDVAELRAISRALPRDARAEAEELQVVAGRLQAAIHTLLHDRPHETEAKR
jgi:methyl-accepting chemotaxis protein